MKNNFKKLLTLFVALTLVLVACSSDNDTDDAQTTQTDDGSLTGEITVQAEDSWGDYYQAAIDRVKERHPDVEINIVELPAFDHIEVIENTDPTNEDVADVFTIPADRFTGFAQNDVLAALPAQDMADNLGGFGNFDDGLGGIFKVNDEYLAFPYNIETLITFVNTSNAEAQNIDYTNVFELTEQQNPETVLLPAFNAWFGVSPNLAGDITLLEETDNGFNSTYTNSYQDLTPDQKATFDALYDYWRLHNDAGTVLFDAEAGYGYIDQEFSSGGNGVIRLDGPWATTSGGVIADEIEAGNVEIFPINHITVAGREFIHWQGGWALVVNSRIEADQNKMAIAQELIQELVNPEYAVDLYRATGKILENASVDAYASSDLSDVDKDVIENVLKSYEISEPRPIFREYGEVWDTWENAVLSWNSVNPQDAESAYQQINASFTQMIEQISAQ